MKKKKRKVAKESAKVKAAAKAIQKSTRVAKSSTPLPAFAESEVKAALERVIKAPAKDALACMLSAWQSFPCAAIAEALIKTSPLPPEFADITSGGATDALARLDRLDEVPRDPRVSDLYVSWVGDPPYHATSSKPFHKLVLKEIARHNDPRAIDALLKSADSARKRVNGRVMKMWLYEEARELSKTLAESTPGAGVPPLPKGLSDSIAKAKKALTEAAKVAPSTKAATSPSALREAELLAAIYKHPDDDAPRAVYADYLIEKNDPRGEFIAMQLARSGRAPTAAEKKREMTILRKHVRRWLAELSNVVGNLQYSIDVGPFDGDRWSARFDRGFLDGCWIGGTPAKLERIVGHPSLATVSDLFFWGSCPGFLEHPVLGSLKYLKTDTDCLTQLPGSPCGKNLRGLEMEEDRIEIDKILDVTQKLPKLETLHLEFYDDPRASDATNEATMATVKRSLARTSKLTSVRIVLQSAKVETVFERESPSSKWRVSFPTKKDSTKPLGKRFAALV